MTWTQAAFGRITLGLKMLGFLVLLGLAASFVWMVQETRRYADAVVATQEVRVAAAQLLGSLQDAETGQRGFLLTGDAAYLAPFEESEQALESDLPELGARLAAEGGNPALEATLDGLITAKLAEIRRTIALAQQDELAGAIDVVREGRGKALMDQIRGLLQGIEARALARLQDRSATLERAGGVLLAAALGGCALVALLGLATLTIAMRYTRDLDSAQAALKRANASLEQRVQARTGSLVAANEEIQRFAYIVSHDLRAPLVNVMGFTQELETALVAVREAMDRAEIEAPALVTPALREAVREDIPEAIGFIRSSTNRMDRLIGAILALSREGRRRLVAEPVPLGATLESLAGSLAHQLDARGAELRLQPPFPTLESDRLALEQILGNLLDNALKYLEPTRPGRILVRARREAGMHAIDVVDNGRGIAARDHGRVFELFRRSGPQDQPGEGIGLAHVRALARRMGGDIRLTSRLGEGSVFTLLLPDKLPAADPALQPSPEEQPA
ncbi:sensor histidine kinase [Falsiroseomonas selenitidurans]|uniref:histidine kinase n=1 Tax=Falsiroseomonas selenitidurans TaxID=2716335 RepID=A0ABX1E3P9_9PROT|nr:CHASE3 domain-containing protein [Falsiroseomonas selenitidurans]NKC31335.1 GHKL domain-containing protein [Falsiroseomonas selenitidurans]